MASASAALALQPKGTTSLGLQTYITQSLATQQILIPLPIPCLYASKGCRKEFDLSEELSAHVTTTVTTDRDHEWCKVCDVGFYNLKELKRHLVTSPNDVHRHCPVCGHFEAKSEGGLQLHVQRAHRNEKILQCLACSAVAYGAVPMLEHFQEGICKGLMSSKADENASVEELDTRGAVGEGAWPSLAGVSAKASSSTSVTTTPEKKKAHTIRIFEQVKKEKKAKLNIHKFGPEARLAMSYNPARAPASWTDEPVVAPWAGGTPIDDTVFAPQTATSSQAATATTKTQPDVLPNLLHGNSGSSKSTSTANTSDALTPLVSTTGSPQRPKPKATRPPNIAIPILPKFNMTAVRPTTTPTGQGCSRPLQDDWIDAVSQRQLQIERIKANMVANVEKAAACDAKSGYGGALDVGEVGAVGEEGW